MKINKPTGKGTRAVGDKNETKQEEGKRNNKRPDVQGERTGGIPTYTKINDNGKANK